MIDRITILGGSSVYTPELILSIIARNMKVREIVLVGHKGKKLNAVTAFCQRIVRKSGFPATIIGTDSVREGVSGAKYILNHIRVGGMEARMRDEMNPPKFGMLGDETLGAGGIANAMRTLPVVLEHAAIIEEVNPSAYFINVTNPIGLVMEALIRYSNLNVMGVDDLPGTYIRKVANVLQHPVDRMRIDYIGLNHLGWIQDVKIDGRSRMSHLLELLEKQPEDGFDYELIELFRMIPTRATGLFFHRGEILKKQKSGSRFRAEVLHEAEKRILELYMDEHLSDLPDLTRQRNAVWYEETVLPLVEGLESNTEKDFILCVRNGECIRDLPEDSSVEVPVSVSAAGLKPRKVGSLPRFLKGVFLAAKESDRLTVEAVKHRSYEYALQALTINPFVPSLDTAKSFLDRMIKDEKIELH